MGGRSRPRRPGRGSRASWESRAGTRPGGGRGGIEAEALHILGTIHGRADAGDAGRAHHERVLALASELGVRPLIAHCHLSLRKLYGRTGDRTKAQAHLGSATVMYREMEMSVYLTQAEAALGEAA
jgi:hypothetical protein